jgi:hypothetical protein
MASLPSSTRATSRTSSRRLKRTVESSSNASGRNSTDEFVSSFTYLLHLPLPLHLIAYSGRLPLPLLQKGAVPRTLLSDELSGTLNALQVELEESHGLYEIEASRKVVLRKAIPKTLVDKVGLETLMERLPETYLRALWSAYVSSRYLYVNGIGASQVDFFLYMSSLGMDASSA